MARNYSTGIMPERHAELMESIEARAARRAELMAELPPPDVASPQWLQRDRTPYSINPIVIPGSFLEGMGLRLGKRGHMVGNQFTKNIPEIEKKKYYEAYRISGNKQNTRVETEPQEIMQAWLALKRQPEHLLDSLHRRVWIQWQTALVHQAGIERLKKDVNEGRTLNNTARRIGASALEDFGFSLIESNQYRRYNNGYKMARHMIDIAVEGSERDGVVHAQSPLLFLVVQREQERREQHWGDLLATYEQPIDDGWGGFRRELQDQADEITNNELINQLVVG